MFVGVPNVEIGVLNGPYSQTEIYIAALLKNILTNPVGFWIISVFMKKE